MKRFWLFSILTTVLLIHPLIGATYHWNGAGVTSAVIENDNNLWSVAGNWLLQGGGVPGTPPGPGDVVVIAFTTDLTDFGSDYALIIPGGATGSSVSISGVNRTGGRHVQVTGNISFGSLNITH